MNNNIKEEISLKELILKVKDWFSFIVSKWKIILLFCVIGSSLGYLYSINKDILYVAELTFAIEEDKPMGLGGSLASSFGIDLGGSNTGGIFSSSNMLELFKSRRMIEKTLLTSVPLDDEIISFADMFITINDLDNKSLKIDKNKLLFSQNKNRQEFTREQDSILGKIYSDITTNYLKVSQLDKKTSIITMEMISKNEVFSKYFVEALAQVVSDDYKDTKSKKSRINMMVLQHQTDSVRAELNNAISGVAIANDNTFNLNPALNIHRVPTVKKEVDIQANTAILTELVKQLEISKVSVRKDTPLIQVIDKPIFPLEKLKFGRIKGIFLGWFFCFFLVTIVLSVKKFFSHFV